MESLAPSMLATSASSMVSTSPLDVPSSASASKEATYVASASAAPGALVSSAPPAGTSGAASCLARNFESGTHAATSSTAKVPSTQLQTASIPPRSLVLEL